MCSYLIKVLNSTVAEVRRSLPLQSDTVHTSYCSDHRW